MAGTVGPADIKSCGVMGRFEFEIQPRTTESAAECNATLY